MKSISPQRVADIFVKATDTLVDDFDLVDFLGSITRYAARASDTAAVGLLLVDHRDHLRFMASSEESSRLRELFTAQNEQGPCRDCFTEGNNIITEDLRLEDHRWPAFAPRAVAAGFASACALPLRHHGRTIGTLGTLGPPGEVLSTQSRQVVQALGTIATIAILQERAERRTDVLTEQLQSALNTRVVIEQAKGFLAQLWHVDSDNAYRLLYRYSRSHELHLSQVARDITSDPTTHPGLTHPPPAAGNDT